MICTLDLSDNMCFCRVFFFKQKTAYEMRISDWSSDVCSSDLEEKVPPFLRGKGSGWVTAEYGMLPRATHTRGSREAARSEERSVGKECVSTCRSRWSP